MHVPKSITQPRAAYVLEQTMSHDCNACGLSCVLYHVHTVLINLAAEHMPNNLKCQFPKS